MHKFIISHKEFFIGFILTLSLLWPFFAGDYFTHHDDVQIIRIFEMNKCFLDHQIPCRWVPDLGGLYGYPLFNYYAPLPYYFGEIIYLITHSLLISAKLMFALSFVGSYIFMYLLASKFWGKLGGSLSAIFYVFAPYHALDFYVRGAMGEMWGLMFFPAIFWAFIRLKEKPNIQNLLISSLFLAGLITSHNLSTMIFLPFCLIWVLLLFIKNNSRLFLIYSVLSIILGILLSSFYLFPVIVEKDLVHVDSTVGGYFGYTEHFKGLRKLFIERSWGWGASVREIPGSERDGLSFQIGWVHLLAWILAIVTAKFLWKKNKWISGIIIFSSISILLSVFMIHPRSVFIWKIIEPLKYLQFPWRFLMLIIFFISFLSGSIFLIIKNYTKFIWVGLLVVVVAFNFSYFRPEKFIQTTDAELLTGKNWDKQIKRSIFDYLPIYAHEPPVELATQRYEIIIGDSEVNNFREGTNWIEFETVTKSHTILRLSQYYFPDWKINVDGKPINVEYKNNNLGLMTIILGKGNHTVEARLYDTPVRTISNIITVVTFVLSLILFLFQVGYVKKWIGYYRKRIN